MAKFFVVQGSVGLPSEAVAHIGEAVDLTEEQAKGLLAAGFVVDEKSFAGLKKMVEGASESGAVLDKKLSKLAAGLSVLKAKSPAKGK